MKIHREIHRKIHREIHHEIHLEVNPATHVGSRGWQSCLSVCTADFGWIFEAEINIRL